MNKWRMTNRLGLFLMIMMVFGIVGPSYAQEKTASEIRLGVNTEVKQHWAKEYILDLVDQGVINGYEDETFKANQAVTRAEFTLIATNLFNYTKSGTKNFSDVADGMWYSKSISAAAEQGFLIGYNGKVYPDNNVTREEAAVILARILQCKGDGDLSQFKDGAKTSSWAKDGLSAMVKAGYFTGDSQGTIRPKDGMTRGEVAKVFALAAGKTYRQAGTYDVGKVTGNVTINCPNVTLRNGEIEGDLYITEGAGAGVINLEQVKVKGRTIAPTAQVNYTDRDTNEGVNGAEIKSDAEPTTDNNTNGNTKDIENGEDNSQPDATE